MLSPEEEKNVAVIRRLTELANREIYDEMDALFTADYVDHNPGWQASSVSDLKKIIADGHKNFAVNNEIQDILASGDMVFVYVINRGRHLSTVFGVAPTGKETSLSTFEIYRFKNGRIAERWVVSDLISFMKQVGAKLPDFV